MCIRDRLADLGRTLEVMRESLEGRKYLERYIQALTHEMKSPMAAIHGAAELLEEGLPEAERRLFVANIQEQNARLQRLVERMLGLANLQHREELTAPVVLGVLDVVERCAEAKTSALSLIHK